MNSILCDTRWIGSHGIGRFAHEIFSRLPGAQPLPQGLAPYPFHPLEIPWLSSTLLQVRPQVYFSPGFNPPLWSPVPFVFTIHDLIFLHFQNEASRTMQLYFRSIVRLSTHRAYRVLTVSEFSKREIVKWAKIDEQKVVVVGNGVGLEFMPEGIRYQPGYPYLLYVGNRRSHKNIPSLLIAFAQAKIDVGIRLLLSGHPDSVIIQLVHELQLDERVVFTGFIPEAELPSYYRGALALVFPSLHEGFGLPPLEAMACGTPVLTSNVTSLPEVVGDAAVLINPFSIDAISRGIEQIVEEESLCNQLKVKGLNQVRKFSWEHTAKRVLQVLEQAINE